MQGFSCEYLTHKPFETISLLVIATLFATRVRINEITQIKTPFKGLENGSK